MINRGTLLLTVVIVIITSVLLNVPYVNLLFLGIVERLVYGWIVVLLIFQPGIEKIVKFLILELIVWGGLLIIGNNFISEISGLTVYVSLVYMFFKLKTKAK